MSEPASEIVKLTKLSLPTGRFINEFSVAQNIVANAVSSHDTYWKLIEACNRHIAGEKPIPPDELKRKGMGWVYNFNYGKARAKIEKGVAESCASISAALSLGYVTFRNQEESDLKDPLLSFLGDSEKRGIIASVIGSALTNTLASETRLSGWLNETEYPTFAFGYCAVVFNKFDWMPEPIHPLKIAFRPRTKPEKIHQFVTFTVMEAEDLFDRWITARNEEVAMSEEANGTKRKMASSGWNLAALEEVLLKAFKGKLADNKVPDSWEQVIPLYNQNASVVISNTESIGIAKIFHRELDKTLSEVYIPWNNSWQDKVNLSDPIPMPSGTSTNNIIFQKNHGLYVQEHHIGVIRDSGFTTESGCIQDLRGIARPAVDNSIRYNRYRNGLGNKMNFVGSPMFEQPTTQTAEKFKVTVSSGFVLLPTSHAMIDKQPNFDINSHIAVLNYEEKEYLRDTQQFDATIQGRLTSRPNKGEVQQVAQEVESTRGAKQGVKMKDYSTIFQTVLKRLPSVKCRKGDPGYEGKLRFFNYLKKNLSTIIKTDADVAKLLAAIDTFVMDPIVGSVETITMALQMAETPFGRNRLKRMLMIAKGFPIEEVNFVVPLIQDKFANLQDARVAAFENDMFFTTNEVIFAGTDDDIVHLDSHIQKCGRVIQGTGQGALSPVDAFKYLENNLAHIILHIEKLGADPILHNKALEYMDQAKQIRVAKDQIKMDAERMMREKQKQEATPQVDPETANRIASDNAKTMSDQQRKDWLAQSRAEQKEKQIQLSHEEKLREIDLKNEREQRNGQS